MTSYLLESVDSLSLQKERDELIQKNGFQEALVSSYDMEEVPLENALEDLDTYSFLSDKKVVVVQNVEALKYEDCKDSFEHLLKYIENPNPDTLLIICANKLNNTTKIAKELKKACSYQEVVLDEKKIIKEYLKDFQIDSNTISFLAEYCLHDYTKILQECLKLKNYKWDEKVITKKDIEEIVVEKLGDSKDLTFSFTRALAMRDKSDALKKYHELLSYQIEPISMIGLLASQFRIIYQVKLLEKQKMTDKKIAELLGEKSDYRIAKTRELTKLYSEKEILEMMQKLADIDYRMKTEDVDGNQLIEMLIINS